MRKSVTIVFLTLFVSSILLTCLLFSGCASSGQTTQGIAKESALTPGMTKTYIQRGKTNQTEVLEIFGPPDLVTHREGKDVWTYDKVSHEISASGGYLTILIAGGAKSNTRQSSRSVMLIVYFDEAETVIDYKLSAAKF